MLLPLRYKKKNLYTLSNRLVQAAYAVTHDLPPDEKGVGGRQVRTFALQVHFCLVRALGKASRKRRRKLLKKGKRELELLDAALGVLIRTKYISPEAAAEVEDSLRACYDGIKKSVKRKK